MTAKRTRGAGKTAKKSRPSPRSGVSLPLGNHPGNTGGKPKRSGRPPLAFKHFLAQLRQDPKVQKELELCLRDRDSRHYSAALKVLTDYDDELPTNLTPEERFARIEALMRAAEERRRLAEGGK